jgi:hypothetical protein
MKTNAKFLTVLAVCALLAFVPLAMAQKGGKKKPPPPPPPGPSDPAIVYTAPGISQDRWDLMVMDADGTNQRTVFTRKFTQNVDGNWSPDGKQLVFHMDDIRGDQDGIYIVNVDGSGLKRIVASDQAIRPAWSPVELAGRYWIAFSDRDRVVLSDGTLKHDRDIFMVDTDGNNLTQLTNTDVGEWETTWSFTGDRIAVHTYDADSGVSDIVLYQVDCTDRTCAATNLGSVINVQGSPLAGKDAGEADWARTQDKLLVSVGTQLPTGRWEYDMWCIDLQNPSVPEQLTNDPVYGESDISWLPNDTGIAFLGFGGGLWKMGYPAGTPELIVTPEQAGVRFFYTLKWRRNP